MLHAKATKFNAGLVGLAEQLLASTDLHGSFAGIPGGGASGQRGDQDPAGPQRDGQCPGRAP